MGRRRKEGSIDPFANRDYKGTPLCPLSFAPSSSLSTTRCFKAVVSCERKGEKMLRDTTPWMYSCNEKLDRGG